MGVIYNNTKIKKAIYNGSPLKQIMLNGVKLLSSEPFNEALALVGYGDFNTLYDVLNNSAVCSAIASNSDATAIMKANYSREMTTHNTNNYNSGLNLLCFKCKCRTYLLKGSNKCTEITGSWTRLGSYDSSRDSHLVPYNCYDSPVLTKSINFAGFNTMYAKFVNVGAGDGANLKIGTSTRSTDDKKYANVGSIGVLTPEWKPSVSLDASQGSYMVKITTYYCDTPGPYVQYIYIE